MHRALVAFITYFVIGAVILKVKYDKTGSDLIIHKAFWKDLPFLIKVTLDDINLYSKNGFIVVIKYLVYVYVCTVSRVLC